MAYNPQKPDADPIHLDRRITEQENVDYSTFATKEYLDAKANESASGGSSSGGSSTPEPSSGLIDNKTIIDWSVVKDFNTFYECEQGLVCCFTFPVRGNGDLIYRAWCFAPGKWNGFVTRMRVMYVTVYTKSGFNVEGYSGDTQLYELREVDFPLGNKNLFFQMYENFKQVYSSKPLRLFFNIFRYPVLAGYYFKGTYSCFLDVENEKLYIADKESYVIYGESFGLGIKNTYDFNTYLNGDNDDSKFVYNSTNNLKVYARVQTYGTANLYNNKGNVFLGWQDLGRVAYSPYFTFDNFTLECTDNSIVNTVLDACGMFLPFETITVWGRNIDGPDIDYNLNDCFRNYLPDPVIARIQA